MTTWRDIGIQQALAARRLSSGDVTRPSVSRAYYAAYSAATHALHRQGVRRFGAHSNPDHADLPALVQHTMRRLSPASRRSMSACLRRLRAFREDADYRPHRTVDKTVRAQALWDMGYTLSLLESVT